MAARPRWRSASSKSSPAPEAPGRLAPLLPSAPPHSGCWVVWTGATWARSSPLWPSTRTTSPTLGRRPGRNLLESAREIVRSLDAEAHRDFAAARQGDSPDPIVVDAAALESAGREAIDDPATVAVGLGEFSEFFSEIEQARVGLSVDWDEAVASERQELLVGLQFLRAAVGSTDRDIVTWAEELGTRANDDRVFRPAGTYLRFRQEIEAMKSASRDVVDGWIASEAAIRDPD